MRVIKLSETKLRFLLFFDQQKDWVFCIHYFWRMKRKSTKKITECCFSCQNKSVCQNLARSCKKWKSAKNRYTPFSHEGLQLYTNKRQISLNGKNKRLSLMKIPSIHCHHTYNIHYKTALNIYETLHVNFV